MDLRSDFAYAWDLTKAGVYATLSKKGKDGEDLTLETANRVLKAEKLCWREESRVQYAFLQKLDRDKPQQAKQFREKLNEFSFSSIESSAGTNMAGYLLGIAVAVILGVLLGWFMPASWILPRLIGRGLTIAVAVLVLGGAGASICLGLLKEKQNEQKKKQVEQYMSQLEELRKSLSELCG